HLVKGRMRRRADAGGANVLLVGEERVVLGPSQTSTCPNEKQAARNKVRRDVVVIRKSVAGYQPARAKSDLDTVLGSVTQHGRTSSRYDIVGHDHEGPRLVRGDPVLAVVIHRVAQDRHVRIQPRPTVAALHEDAEHGLTT